MLSEKLLDDLNYLCQHIRGNDTTFGGMQVVLVGDFYQLSPVPSARYGDNGQFAFKSNIWNVAFGHKVELMEVLRQNDNQLVQVKLI